MRGNDDGRLILLYCDQRHRGVLPEQWDPITGKGEEVEWDL